VMHAKYIRKASCSLDDAILALEKQIEYDEQEEKGKGHCR